MLKRFKPRSLRARLTLWYSSVLILVVLLLAGASRWAMALSLNHALDQSLRYRLIGMRHFIDENGAGGVRGLASHLSEIDTLGELFQVFGPHGELLAQSEGLKRHGAGSAPPPDPAAGILFRNAGPHRFPVRMATQRMYLGADPLIVEVADPQRKFENLLHAFDAILLIALPFTLAFATLGGYWLSGRALAPVGKIISEARAISPENLSARLSVPDSEDELQRLSETLNQMLLRVEQSFLKNRQFTADASHELRAPMTLIYTSAQSALRRERSREELKDALQKILHEAERCTNLINQLLSLARSDSPGARLELQPADLALPVSEVANEIRLLASNKSIAVSITLPEHPVHAAVDLASFRRMLLILLDNAVKYTPQGGRVTVTLTQREADAFISVADSGIGISAENLPHVFDRFWRADQVRSRDAGGSGLGLAIARQIAAAHHATLTVASDLEKGSTFTVSIAVVPAPCRT